MALSESERLRRIVRKGMRHSLGADIDEPRSPAGERERLLVAGVAVVHACGLPCNVNTFRKRVATSTFRDDLRVAHAIADYFQHLTYQPNAPMVASFVSIGLALEYMDRKAEARAEVAVAPHLPGNHVGRLACNVGPAWVLFPLRAHRCRTIVESWTEAKFEWWLSGRTAVGGPRVVERVSRLDFRHELARLGSALGELDAG